MSHQVRLEFETSPATTVSSSSSSSSTSPLWKTQLEFILTHCNGDESSAAYFIGKFTKPSHVGKWRSGKQRPSKAAIKRIEVAYTKANLIKEAPLSSLINEAKGAPHMNGSTMISTTVRINSPVLGVSVNSVDERLILVEKNVDLCQEMQNNNHIPCCKDYFVSETRPDYY